MHGDTLKLEIPYVCNWTEPLTKFANIYVFTGQETNSVSKRLVITGSASKFWLAYAICRAQCRKAFISSKENELRFYVYLIMYSKLGSYRN